MSDTIELATIGRLAERLQASPRTVEAAADRAKIEPLFVVDGRRYYAERDVPRIRQQILSRKAVSK